MPKFYFTFNTLLTSCLFIQIISSLDNCENVLDATISRNVSTTSFAYFILDNNTVSRETVDLSIGSIGEENVNIYTNVTFKRCALELTFVFNIKYKVKYLMNKIPKMN